MKSCKIIFAFFLLSPALFLGCGSNNMGAGRAATSTPESVDSQGRESGGAARQTSAPPARAVLDEPKVIATRRATGGFEVDITRLAVTGDLLTMELRIRNPTRSSIYFSPPAQNISIIDDATSRRYSVVKDQDGKYMESTPGYVNEGKEAIAWYKFPALPPQTRTISITIPEVSPFDGIPYQQ